MTEQSAHDSPDKASFTSASEILSFQSEEPATAERAEQQAPLLDAAYQNLKEREARQPQTADIITVLGLHEGQPEYEILANHGVNSQDLGSNRLTRGALLEAGYVFINRLGNGEKPVLSGEVPDPDSPTGVLNLTDRILLTREELERVYAFQQANPELYWTGEEDLDEVRKDMLSFVYASTHEPPFESEYFFHQFALPTDDRNWDLRHWGIDVANQPTDDGPWIKMEQDIATVMSYWRAQVATYREVNPGTDLNDLQIESQLRRTFAKSCEDIYSWPGDPKVFGIKDQRGHRIKALRKRQTALMGSPSPFLESGFVFSSNPDVEIFLRDTPGQMGERRLNMGNIHLIGGHPDFPGLSEMGGTNDQIYMSGAVYIQELYPSSPAERAAVHAHEMTAFQRQPMGEVILQFQERLLNAARQWASETGLTLRSEDLGPDWRQLERRALEEHRRQQEEDKSNPDSWL